jgi:NDP-sugar pyrophosphorylase family protein
VLDVHGGQIRGFTEKPSMTYRVSMGVYGMSLATIAHYPAGLAYGFDQLVLDLLQLERFPTSYEFDGYWLDIGRPDDYDRANEAFGGLRGLLLPERVRQEIA